jgi:hypothetical protein
VDEIAGVAGGPSRGRHSGRRQLQADACGPGYKYDSNTRLVLEKKEDMRRRGVASPDGWDPVARTFAEPISMSAGFGRDILYEEHLHVV